LAYSGTTPAKTKVMTGVKSMKVLTLIFMVLLLAPNTQAQSVMVDKVKLNKLFAEYEKSIQDSIKIEQREANTFQKLDMKLHGSPLQEIPSRLRAEKKYYLNNPNEVCRSESTGSLNYPGEDAYAFSDQITGMIFQLSASCPASDVSSRVENLASIKSNSKNLPVLAFRNKITQQFKSFQVILN
jgi:hypothetical protein